MATATKISDSSKTIDTEPEKQSMITVASQSENEAPWSEEHRGEESLELLGEVYHLASGGSASIGLLDDHSPILARFRTPMENTVLHLAAMHGNDAMVDRVAAQYPKLLFSCNANGDTPLHVAARAGHVSTLRMLLATCADPNAAKLLELMEMENNQGNTVLHEAIASGPRGVVTSIFHALESLNPIVEANYLRERAKPDHLVEEAWRKIFSGEKNANKEEDRLVSWPQCCYELAWNKVNKKDQSALCLAVEARLTEAVNQILERCPANATPKGISPLLAAIMKRDAVMLNSIVSQKREWIHLRGKKRRLPLHCAAFIGYHEGVVYLLDKCKTCSNERDEDGSLPLHQAARGGHVKVVKELLRYCPDPSEMVDSNLCNILHIAAERGRVDMVRYILRTTALEKMINQRDRFGRTPLHVATIWRHLRIVYDLTWDDRVDLDVVDGENRTALDIAYGEHGAPSSIAESLVEIALRSAGAKETRRFTLESPGLLEAKPTIITENWEEMEKAFSSRVDALSLVSTLIVTASVAACLSVPGEAEGTAHNLHKAMFHFFILCITISFFSSISATIILLWAKLGSTREMYNSTFDFAMPLIEAALVTLSLAFLAGVYTVISKLTWLATTFLVITVIFVLILCVLLIFFYLPIFSTNKILRYISYYPFLFSMWMIKWKQ